MTDTNTNQPEEWEKELDKILSDKTRREEVYSDAPYGCMECGGGLNEEFVKSFITQLLSSERDRLRAEVEGMKVRGDMGDLPKSYNHIIDTLLSKISSNNYTRSTDIAMPLRRFPPDNITSNQ